MILSFIGLFVAGFATGYFFNIPMQIGFLILIIWLISFLSSKEREIIYKKMLKYFSFFWVIGILFGNIGYQFIKIDIDLPKLGVIKNFKD